MRHALAVILVPSLFTVALQTQQVNLCAEAVRVLSDEIGLAVKADPDTVSDFRTGRKHAACRVTAAGLTTIGVAGEAARFYERIRAAGWTRTPDPWDSPGESSLRFRKAGSDCLFNVYEGALLLTEAERKVAAARAPAAGEKRYGVFVTCVPVLPAKPRGQGQGPTPGKTPLAAPANRGDVSIKLAARVEAKVGTMRSTKG